MRGPQTCRAHPGYCHLWGRANSCRVLGPLFSSIQHWGSLNSGQSRVGEARQGRARHGRPGHRKTERDEAMRSDTRRGQAVRERPLFIATLFSCFGCGPVLVVYCAHPFLLIKFKFGGPEVGAPKLAALTLGIVTFWVGATLVVFWVHSALLFNIGVL